ncbi:MAG: MATE family efflux transporter [Halobacteriales archaeon]|nr:MATE family efflux transporter [Halobacteriales archaeon]
MQSLRALIEDAARRFPALLARLGVVDRRMGEEAFLLATPVMVTGGLRILLRLADFVMVGIALGGAGLAALELGFQYFFIGFALSLAVSSGTISVVARYEGAGQRDRAELALKQSLWLTLAVSLPLTWVGWTYSPQLIDVLTDDPEAIRLGAAYLQILMLSLAFRFWSLVASRALAGTGDTRTPMFVRLVTLPTNVVLNALLIFGLFGFPRLGIVGAAIGTAVTNIFTGVVFLWLALSGRYDATLHLGGRQLDTDIIREILRVGVPLGGMRLLQTFGRFPFLFVLGTLGTPVLAAYAVGRQVVLLAMMPAWGYSTAASTLVGQAIGAGEDEEATRYGWQTLRIAVATQLLIAAVVFALSRPVVQLFNPDDVGLAVDFVRVFAFGVAGFSIDRVMRGALRGAGDTRWPLYGMFIGSFLLRLPIAFLALPATYVVTLAGVSVSPGMGLGLAAVFAAILVDLYVKGAINTLRFASGRWRAVARESDIGTAPGG